MCRKKETERKMNHLRIVIQKYTQFRDYVSCVLEKYMAQNAVDTSHKAQSFVEGSNAAKELLSGITQKWCTENYNATVNKLNNEPFPREMVENLEDGHLKDAIAAYPDNSPRGWLESTPRPDLPALPSGVELVAAYLVAHPVPQEPSEDHPSLVLKLYAEARTEKLEEVEACLESLCNQNSDDRLCRRVLNAFAEDSPEDEVSPGDFHVNDLCKVLNGLECEHLEELLYDYVNDQCTTDELLLVYETYRIASLQLRSSNIDCCVQGVIKSYKTSLINANMRL